jgi:hypothetical protein
VALESEQASWEDREKEQERIERSGVDENAEQLAKAAAAFGMSIEEYLKFLDSRPNSNRFGKEKDELNIHSRTSRVSPHSGTKFNTSNWDPAFKHGSMGKEKKKLRGGK